MFGNGLLNLGIAAGKLGTGGPPISRFGFCLRLPDKGCPILAGVARVGLENARNSVFDFVVVRHQTSHKRLRAPIHNK